MKNSDRPAEAKTGEEGAKRHGGVAVNPLTAKKATKTQLNQASRCEVRVEDANDRLFLSKQMTVTQHVY